MALHPFLQKINQLKFHFTANIAFETVKFLDFSLEYIVLGAMFLQAIIRNVKHVYFFIGEMRRGVISQLYQNAVDIFRGIYITDTGVQTFEKFEKKFVMVIKPSIFNGIII